MADFSQDAASSEVGIITADGEAVQAQRELPEALQTPTRRVGATFQITYFLSNIMLWMAKVGWR